MSTIRIDPEFRSLIPALRGEELQALEESLVLEGCRDALIVWRNTLLDGHNRLDICKRRKIEYRVQSIDLPDREAAKDWIDANQLARRNLSPDAFKLLLGRRYNRTKKDHGGDRRSSGQNVHLKTSEALGAEHGVDEKTVRRAGKFAQRVEANPALQQAILEGKPARKADREHRRAAVAEKVAAIPQGKFRVIYADPPWKYGDDLTEAYGSTEYHYPSLTIGELCALPVTASVADDAVLFLWATSPLLEDAFAVIRAWGFKYKASFVWDKVRHNWGHYNSVRHEFLLVATRGSCLPDAKELVDSVQSIERTDKHSEKPEEFRTIIDRLYTTGPRLELFARKKVEGWQKWGNQ